MNHLKPDFIIVGAMKGGTSTLAYFLEKQDNILMAPGEINYFDNDRNFIKGTNWYLKQFKSNEYEKIWGEKTATYHYHEKVPERIFDYNPNIKLLWILRNPVKRAYSNYWHRVKYGLEFDTFENAVKKELGGFQEDKWGLYLKRSIYIDQIKAFNKYFNIDQMYFIVFENLVKDIEYNLKNILKYLGADNQNITIPDKKAKNKTYLPSSPGVLRISNNIFGQTLPFKIIRKTLEKKSPGYPKLRESTENKLNDYFRKSILQLEHFTYLDLSSWKK